MSPFPTSSNALMLKMHATATTTLTQWYLNRPLRNTYSITLPSHFCAWKINEDEELALRQNKTMRGLSIQM